MSFTLTNTNKDVLCIVHNHFKYRHQRVMASGDISWRCTVRQCTLTIHKNANISHNHNIVENRDIQLQIVRNICKQKVTECVSERPNKIIRCELMAVETTELLHNDNYRERWKIIPAVPTSLFELIQQLKISNITTHRNETFCHVDEESKIVILKTNNNLEYLVNNSHTILGDSTFYVFPAHFE
ncbi:Uncharacterized protein FWK35_00006352 [Aphis craccivora]|uniref:FLYWCH-type domain-containing protein n=1 Tax=Aphis craccivora TaxID=307492 RepID=A0A6G0YHP2_APHCR|nr:Uncharacterized protein FWK35_00006352 [Aphis craccivora]